MIHSNKIPFSAIIVFLSGCALSDHTPAVHDFGVNPVKFEHPLPANRAEISVEAPRWLQDHRIRYRLLYAEPTQVRFYTKDRWIAPPSELLEQYLRAAPHPLSSSLQIKLLDFEQQFASPSQSRVLLRFRAEVLAVGNHRQMDSKEFKLERLTLTPDAKGAVRGFSELIRQASNQVDRWLNDLPQQHGDSP